MYGRVTKVFRDKRYGFIFGEDKKSYFIHHSNLNGEYIDSGYFGYIGTLKVSGAAHRAWVFVMALSYSRYMYVCITLDQSVQTFIRCHTQAFHYFGGVPRL